MGFWYEKAEDSTSKANMFCSCWKASGSGVLVATGKSAFVDWWGKRRGIIIEKHSAYELFRFLVLSTFATSSQPILNEQTISPTG